VEAAYRAGLYGLRDAGRLAAGTRSLTRVVAEAPGFGPAWAALAESWLQQAEIGLEAPALAMPRARQAALTASDLGEADRAGLVLAAVSLHHDRDLPAARRWLDTTRLDSARALLLDAELQFLEGQPEAALRSARRAEELDPVCPVVQGHLAELLYLSRRFPEAAAAWERAAQVAPDLVGPRVRLFHAWRQAGNPAAARRAGLEVLRLLGRTDDLPEDYTAFLRGNLAHLQAEAQRQPAVVADRIAVLHAALGEDEQARAWLERARTERSPGLALTLAADPDLDRLRSRADFPRS
jgi:tetratricopeptide (TPR) repeat protein